MHAGAGRSEDTFGRRQVELLQESESKTSSVARYREPAPGESRACDQIEVMKETALECAARAMHLLEAQEEDPSRRGDKTEMIKVRVPNFRTSDTALVRDGKVEQMSLNRILEIASALDCRFRMDVIPPVVRYRVDERTHRVIVLLERADRDCQAAVADIGRRSYPLTGIVVRHAGTQCLLAVEAIRNSPEFWHREATLFSAMLFSAQSLLEQTTVTGKQWKIRKAAEALKSAAEALEDLAETVAGERTATQNRVQ